MIPFDGSGVILLLSEGLRGVVCGSFFFLELRAVLAVFGAAAEASSVRAAVSLFGVTPRS